MNFQIRFTPEALEDLLRLFDFHAEHDIELARRSSVALRQAITVLEEFPFSGRKIDSQRPFLRELLVPFGRSGYVALFEIEENSVTVLALRHQRESDYF
ncbi:type II toxin-antitoxin system RelE/ParE family toxin [Microvenator marinus]|jgi:plasmid stabilization system protein ParE|uniref:Type II toxin-antitoxin system RelE/ParE family toxin n=1 Tax=Microvenator marinus TaxID=2600177 RepID=A0A5B8XV53_9DELT|nr:type II toxin-antitoxin system RelE/ParE family toxin [Microvenator marinus]QED29294.1 type II toxin-antitoxin system RelE/ParE family toxin [Microvenator marinus]